MKTNISLTSISLRSSLAFALVATPLISTSLAVTNFLVPPEFASDSRAGAAEWEFFTTTSGSHGAGAGDGSNPVISSDLSTTILVPFSSPPGGLLGGGDTYYAHDGALSWAATLTLADPVDYVRVSYALVGSSFGAPEPFPSGPSIAGATAIGNSSYSDGGSNVVYYTDFLLDSPAPTVSAAFSDLAVPFSSFRSVNGVRIAGYSMAPSPVPEPSRALLIVCGAVAVLGRRTRRTASRQPDPLSPS